MHVVIETPSYLWKAEEISMSSFGKRLIKAAKEARAIARGEADPATYRVHVPTEIDVRAIRARLGLSQNGFARRFGISPANLRNWEQGIRAPDGPARVLLTIIDREPEAVERALRSA
jgi:putative transcriptional regulator